MRLTRFSLLLAFAVLPPASALFAQEQPQLQPPPQQQQTPKISVQTKLVRVFATVRDKHGKIVSGLTQNDFVLDEDGRPQTITYFARENDLALTLGLLVDTSRSQRTVLDDERSASYTFFDQILRPSRDQAFVIHFDRIVELLQDVTPSRAKLEAALKLLQTPEEPQQTGDDDSHRGGWGGGGGTHLYDAIYLASGQVMQKLQGRKAIIVLSDGVDRGSKEDMEEAIEAAQRADVVVYSILFKGEQPFERRARGGFGGVWGGGGGGGYPGGRGGQRRFPQEERPDGKKVLTTISQDTGGRLFQVSKKLPIDQIYSEIEEDLRNQYILGYVPDKMQSDAAYHKIHLVTTKKGLVVLARDGYFSTP